MSRGAEVTAVKGLTALIHVALELSTVDTVEALTDVIIERRLAEFGAEGGAIAVRTDASVLRMTVTASLRDHAQDACTELPVDASHPACVSAATGQRVLLADRQASLAWAPEMSTALFGNRCQAWASLPLRTESGVLGSLTVGWAEPRGFPGAEVEILDALAALCAHRLEQIQGRQVERDSAVIERRMSETLQRSMLSNPPLLDRLQVVVRYRPAAHEAQVGGDWYDAFRISDGATYLVIGDVTGHDREAAAVMGQVRNLLRGVACTLGEPPAAVLGMLDRVMRDLAIEPVVTAVLARVDDPLPDTGTGLRRFLWSNAGHPPPLIIDPNGTVSLLWSEPEPLLGHMADTQRTDHELALRPGTTVVLYTDGLVERRGSALDDGLGWLVAAATRFARLEIGDLCDTLLDQVGHDCEDDIALLVLRV